MSPTGCASCQQSRSTTTSSLISKCKEFRPYKLFFEYSVLPHRSPLNRHRSLSKTSLRPKDLADAPRRTYTSSHVPGCFTRAKSFIYEITVEGRLKGRAPWC